MARDSIEQLKAGANTIARDIADNLEAALEQFKNICEDLKKK